MMREVPVRDTDPDPYTLSRDMQQEEDRSSPIAFTVEFGNSQGNSVEKNRKLERFALRSSQRTRSGVAPLQQEKSSPTSRDKSRKKVTPGNENFDLLKEQKSVSMTDADDTFESESDDNPSLTHENVPDKNESNPSETGTYTVDKEDDSPTSPTTQEPRLESLLEETKSSYVEEWATKHAFPGAGCSPPSLSPVLSPEDRRTPATATKSRRLLPRPPQDPSPESELCSSVSVTTPPQLQESDEESSYVTHTQHLVDVMEERLKQKTLKKLELKSTRSLASRNYSVAKQQEPKLSLAKPAVKPAKSSTKVKSPEPQLEAMEAWKRRKNYDPMAAAGRKKSGDLSRKHSAGSSKSGVVSPPQDDTSESDSFHRERPHTGARSGLARHAASAPSSAKSRSSESSGYISRSADSRADKLRKDARPSSTSTTPRTSNPLRRLAHTNSSSSVKAQQSTNRSSSSLTSKEAEFQAWKRRKNYDPIKSASRPSSSKTKEPRKLSSGTSRSYSNSTKEPSRQSPRPKRLLEMTSSDMSKSLIMEELSSDTPMQRSNSFQCNKKIGRIVSEDESEDDYGSSYESSLAGSQIRSYPHFYLDDDELILPIQPLQSSHSHLSHRSMFSGARSAQSQMSPSKSRTKLEALDTLVISTIHNVSNKLCSTSATLLRQAAAVFPEQDEEQASTLETVVYLLEDIDLPPSPAKKTSRELSGTLRNLKKIEQALEMMKKLMDGSELEEE